MRWLWQWITFTTVSVSLFAIYFGFTALQIYKIVNPQFIDTDGPTLDPLWEPGQALDAAFFLSPRRDWNADDFASPSVVAISSFSDLTFDWRNDNARSHDLTISPATLRALAASDAKDDDVTQLWHLIRSNGTVYLHVHVTTRGASPDPLDSKYDQLQTIHQAHALVTFAPRRNAKNATYLLAPYFPTLYNSVDNNIGDNNIGDTTTNDPALTAPIVSFWKPHMAVRLVTDFTKYPLAEVPVLVFQNIQFFQSPDTRWMYKPAMYLDDMGVAADSLVSLNRSVDALPLTISFAPMGYARWQLLLTMELALLSQATLGFQPTDLDAMRAMVANTNPVLLAVTVSVALLHVLFDWLAFKSDVAFWREKSSDMVGISLQSMAITLVSQCIVLLYLVHERATLLITAPSAISCVLLVWKIGKIVRAPTRSTSSSAALTRTRQVDAMATSHMLRVLAPLLIGYAAYSLVYKLHVSWFSWLLASLTGGVYAFGFVLMLPQLVINYELQSVAHLPWRFLVYRALNTFIDDLFAFVITMPTLHRLSCFRDDIVFVVYLYQRWIYPVDTKRKGDDDDGSSGNIVSSSSSDTGHMHSE